MCVDMCGDVSGTYRQHCLKPRLYLVVDKIGRRRATGQRHRDRQRQKTEYRDGDRDKEGQGKKKRCIVCSGVAG